MRLAAFANPLLTNIAQPNYHMKAAVGVMLLERMRHFDWLARRRVFDTSPVTRKSTVPARGIAASQALQGEPR